MLHVISQHNDKCVALVFTQRVTEIENMRHKVIEARQEVFNHNEHEVSKRWAFEEGVCSTVDCFFFNFPRSIFNSSKKTFEPVADQEAILPRESPGEDAAEQLEGVSGL